MAATITVAQVPVGSPAVGTAQIEWPSATQAALELTVSGPEGFYLRQSFAAGQSAVFSVYDANGGLRPTGVYAFELKATPAIDEQTREDLSAVRELGDDAALAKSGKLLHPQITSGYFSIIDGAIEMGSKEEGAAVAEGGNRLAPKVVLTNGDGVIRNSLCVGFDCPDSPVFSDSTILMMENNTRIKFGDTSNSPFPNNDWEIEANSSLSGGANYLGFNDCGTADNDGGCATDLVFAVEAGARQNALYVESDGDVGMGTSNPVVNIHTVDGNTPTLRLDQDGSSGFAPQSWDVAGNETNFFIRDVTGGSTLPFRIRPGAPSSSIFIDTDGNLGFGTASPDADADVTVESGESAAVLMRKAGAVRFRLENTSTATEWDTNNDGNGDFSISLVGTGGNELEIEQDGDIGNCGNPDHDFVISTGPGCTATPRSWIDAGATSFSTSSSRTYKENLKAVEVPNILQRISNIPVYEYDFIGGPKDRIGLIAEDFYQVFGRGSDKELSGQEVQVAMWLAIQELTKRDQQLDAKDAEIADLKARLELLEQAVAELGADR